MGDGVRIGVIGCGRVALAIHLRRLKNDPNARVVAIAEADGSRRTRASKLVPDARPFAEYHELLASDDVDAVVICLPTGLHADAAVAALAAGKHVYLEKPIAGDLPGAGRVLHAFAEARDARPHLVGMIGFNYRYNPVYRQLKRLLAARRVGQVVAVRTSFVTASRELPGWKSRRDGGGGALLDLASHHVDLLRWLFDAEIDAVRAHVRDVLSEQDTATVELRLGATVAQTFVSISSAEEDRIEVYGTGGKLVADRFGSGRVSVFGPKRAVQKPEKLKAAAGWSLAAPGELRNVLLPAVEPSHARALKRFSRAVRFGQPVRPDLFDGYASLAAIVAAEASAAGEPGWVTPHRPPVAHPADAAATDRTGTESTETDRPALSTIVVASRAFADVRRTVAHLRCQTVAGRLELVIVGPSVEALSDEPAGETEGFLRVVRVAAEADQVSTMPNGPPRIDNVDTAAAAGVLAAGGAYVALVEDHAFPEPGWAEAVLKAIDAPDAGYTAIGSRFFNANPDTTLSWSNLLMAYGAWADPVPAGATDNVSRHNVTYRRSVLLAYGGELSRKLGRDGGLLAELVDEGHRFYLAHDAVVRHLNPSRLLPTAELRFSGGRLYAATRARTGGWSAAKRALYVVGGPLIPLVRYRQVHPKLKAAGWRVLPAVAMGLVLEGAGQMVGFALGPGRTAERLAAFEHDRARHMTRRDRERLGPG